MKVIFGERPNFCGRGMLWYSISPGVWNGTVAKHHGNPAILRGGESDALWI